MGKHNEDIYLRTNRKELYKSMRDVLRDNPPEPLDNNPQGFAWWKIAVVLGVIALLLWVLSGKCWATDMKASYYSKASLIKEGTRKAGEAQIMANGRVFDENALTCATGKQYPLGSRLLVTNKANGKSVICVVTDRISRRFYTTRIDLSRGAFLKLSKLDNGIIDIEVKKISIKVK
jgi:rare lipoprotein A